jgi:hypothetical protein
MIVKKPIGAVKIGNQVERLTVGKPVPSRVLAHWKNSKCGEKGKETTVFEALKETGSIGEPEKKEPVKAEIKPEIKSQKPNQEKKF